jgi:hypothetical protein
MIATAWFMNGPRARERLRRREDVERERQPDLDGGVPERIVDSVVVVVHAGHAGQHDAAEAERLDLAQVLDALFRRPHAVWPTPISRVGSAAQYSAIQRL